MTDAGNAAMLHPDLAERVNMIMRPETDVCRFCVLNALLNLIEQQRNDAVKRGILTHALDIQWCAQWSGTPTPVSAYPKHSCDEPPIEDELDGVHQGLNMYLAYLDLEMTPTATVVGQRAWEFLQPFTEREHKIHALRHIFDEIASKVEPPRVVLAHEASVPNEERNPILWQHRQIIRGILFRGDKSNSFTGSGEALLQGVAAIEDERERAIVTGYCLQMMVTHRVQKLAAQATAQGIAHSIVEALFGGKGGLIDVLIFGGPPPKP